MFFEPLNHARHVQEVSDLGISSMFSEKNSLQFKLATSLIHLLRICSCREQTVCDFSVGETVVLSKDNENGMKVPPVNASKAAPTQLRKIVRQEKVQPLFTKSASVEKRRHLCHFTRSGAKGWGPL
jgi:hypothetical protein